MTELIKFLLYLALPISFLVACDEYETLMGDKPLQCHCSHEGKEVSPKDVGIVGEWKYEGYYKTNEFNKLPESPHQTYGENVFVLQLHRDNNYEGSMAPNHTPRESFMLFKGKGIQFKRVGTSDAMSQYPEWEKQFLYGLRKAECYHLFNQNQTLYISYQPDDSQCKTMKFERKTED